MRVLPDPYILAFLLAVGVALLLCYNRLLSALHGSAACFHGDHSTQEMLGNNYVCDSVRISFLLLLPFYALTLSVTGCSRLGYLWTLVALLGLFLLRKAVYWMAGWLSSRQGAFRALERMGLALFVLGMLVSTVAALVVWLVPSIPSIALWIWILAVAVVCAVFYIRRGSSIILSTGFSIFFWVLYLCALEFLPICVVVNIMINGN